MHNFHDTHKHFPPAAICDKDGKPLLSWRVAVLPYIDQNELYKQFHLDEPWNSPHNLPLVKTMPDLFADPDPKVRRLAGDGKTTFQVPVGTETIFFNNVGTKFSEISDGTSMTIMIVEVTPDHAVEWTKPADWEVDLKHPRTGVERTDRNVFTAAWADGSVQLVPVDFNEATWVTNLTRARGDVGKRP
jgi:hypothetical protein